MLSKMKKRYWQHSDILTTHKFLPATYRQHTNHVPTTYQPHTDHLYRIHTNSSTCSLLLRYLLTRFRLGCRRLRGTWSLAIKKVQLSMNIKWETVMIQRIVEPRLPGPLESGAGLHSHSSFILLELCFKYLLWFSNFNDAEFSQFTFKNAKKT